MQALCYLGDLQDGVSVDVKTGRVGEAEQDLQTKTDSPLIPPSTQAAICP